MDGDRGRCKDEAEKDCLAPIKGHVGGFAGLATVKKTGGSEASVFSRELKHVRPSGFFETYGPRRHWCHQGVTTKITDNGF
jgi:hypothetical protein